jgi:hypothetical protein
MYVKDMGIFYEFMNENILLRQMPYVLGMAKEFETLPIYYDEETPLTKSYVHNKDYMCKHKPEHVLPSNKKAICIYYSYLNREPLKTENYQKDLERVLSFSDLFIDNIFDMCIKFTLLHQLQKVTPYKNFGYSCIQTVLDFSENIHQQISHIQNNFNPFLQLPYFNINKINLLKRKNGKIFNNKSTCFYDFLKMDTELRNEVLSKEFTNDQIDDINKTIDAIPTYDLNIEVYTEGFEDILVDDEISIKVTVIRNNLQEGQEVGVTHSLGFTELFDEKICLILLCNSMIIDNSIETVKERKTIHTFNHRFQDANKYKFICDLTSLDYKGINIRKEIDINVCKTSEKRKEHYKDIEKRQVKKIEPSYFQQLLSSVVPIAGDDEEEEEEEEEDKTDDKKDKNKDKNKEKDEDNKEEGKEDENKDKEENEEEEDKKDDKEEHEKND